MLRVVPERESVPSVTKLALVSGCIIKPDTVKVNRSFLTVLEWENSCCVYGQELLGRTVSQVYTDRRRKHSLVLEILQKVL